MRMIAIDLIVWAFSQTVDQAVYVTIVLRRIDRIEQEALYADHVRAAEELDHLTKLEGIAGNRRIIAELTLSFTGHVDFDEVCRNGGQCFEDPFTAIAQFLCSPLAFSVGPRTLTRTFDAMW